MKYPIIISLSLLCFWSTKTHGQFSYLASDKYSVDTTSNFGIATIDKPGQLQIPIYFKAKKGELNHKRLSVKLVFTNEKGKDQNVGVFKSDTIVEFTAATKGVLKIIHRRRILFIPFRKEPFLDDSDELLASIRFFILTDARRGIRVEAGKSGSATVAVMAQ